MLLATLFPGCGRGRVGSGAVEEDLGGNLCCCVDLCLM